MIGSVAAATPVSSQLVVGGWWTVGVQVLDQYGAPTTGTVTAAVTDPNGAATAPVVVAEATPGLYTAAVQLVSAGRWVAVLSVAGVGVVAYVADAGDVVGGLGLPTVDDVAAYLGPTSVDEATLADALAAETAAQASECVTGPTYGADLRQALLRRVARNLALRGLPLAVLQGDSEAGSTVLPGADSEIDRLERRYRRLGAFA